MLQLLKIILKLQLKTQNFKKLSLKNFIDSKNGKIESIKKWLVYLAHTGFKINLGIKGYLTSLNAKLNLSGGLK